MTPIAKTIRASSPQHFLDLLPYSGVFEIDDCVIEIAHPDSATTDDIDKIVRTMESMIHVVDVRVSSTPAQLEDDYFTVIVTQVLPDSPAYIKQRKKK
jgi:hypothetical protein